MRAFISSRGGLTGVAVATAVCLLSGCSGPSRTLEVGVDNVTSNVVVDTAGPTDLPDVPLPPTFTRPGQPAVYPVPLGDDTSDDGLVRPGVPTVPLGPCPDLDLLASIKQPTGSGIPLPPAPHSYTFRTTSSTRKGTGPTTTLNLVSHRSIERVAQTVDANGAVQYTYDVMVREGNQPMTTTTSYLVVPHDPQNTAMPPPQDPTGTVAGQGAPGAPGLYVTRIVGRSGTTVTSSFTPSPPMKMLSLPVTPGEHFDVLSTDGQAAVAYRATVGKPKVVNACGQPVQAVQVTLDGAANLHTTADLNPYIEQIKKCIGVTGLACVQDAGTLCPLVGVDCPPFPDFPPTPALPAGTDVKDPGGARYTSSSGQTDFVATYGIAPQYGGLAVYDEVVSTLQGVGGTVTSGSRSTIDVVPVAARRPSP